MGLFLLSIGLTVAVILLSVKLFLMRKAAREICEGFSQKLRSDTNTLLSISSRDQTMCRLADTINVQLRELRAQRRRFLQGDLELKSAVTSISHDLRTPLTAINGYLDLLEPLEKDPRMERYLAIIRNRTDMLSQLTEELFRYSVITSPDYNTEPEVLSVNSVLEESILSFYAALQEQSITPVIQIPQQKVTRTLSRAILSRVFANLISNALKYSDGDLSIVLTEAGTITFSNTAPHLSQVQVERLFDRFYTVETARKSTGLGLSISRILMEQMHGSLSAHYENGVLSLCVQLPDPHDQPHP